MFMQSLPPSPVVTDAAAAAKFLIEQLQALRPLLQSSSQVS
jgi:hypothetical protein